MNEMLKFRNYFLLILFIPLISVFRVSIAIDICRAIQKGNDEYENLKDRDQFFIFHHSLDVLHFESNIVIV